MGFNSIFTKILGKDVDLLVDIRSSSIGIAILSHKKNNVEVFHTKRYPIFFKTETDAANFSTEVQKVLALAIEETASKIIPLISKIKTPAKIKTVHLFFGSPWYVSKTKSLKLKKSVPFTFTKEMFDSLIKKEGAMSQSTKDKTIEKDITQVILNGYELHDPFNKKATEILLSFYISNISKSTSEKTSALISKHFPKTEIKYYTHGGMLFNVLRNIFFNLNNYTFFDIGGETTDVGVVQNGSLKGISTIPYGKHDFIRNVSKVCKTNYDTVLSSLKLLAEGRLEIKCEGDIESLFKKEEIIWAEKIKEAVAKIIDINQIPQKICIVADKEFIKIAEKLSNSSSLKEKLFQDNDKINVITLDQGKIGAHLEYGKGVKKDIMLELGALHITYKDN